MPPSSNHILAVSGLGNVVGTGGAVARLFARELGYRVALISRPRQEVHDLKDEIAKGGGVAEVFSVEEYSYQSMEGVFEEIKQRWPDGRLKCAVWNTSQWSRIPFLDITEKDITASATINVISATAFSQAAVRAFTSPSPGSEADQGGTLIMTGATSATRGHLHFGAFAAGKHGLRALSQSIAREYGPQGVHVAFVIIDVTILTRITARMFSSVEGKDPNWMQDERQRLSPESIARAYLYLHQQTPDAWTLEMDLRPAKEKF
ncbi:short-chain dehydrogenase/reductase SDR [Rhodotorula toruloides]|uniref:Short-chain dehydrogenase/reductase SDR n=1 Tax=Rhodotorula toruloides TaxID=5286 RepID=A0A511KBX0_RHOTO|nr:short-chain dehydrogenase/reductase SDR [Rhodotorula toruloides]